MKEVIKDIKKSILLVSLVSASFSYAIEPCSNTLKRDLKRTSLTVEKVKGEAFLTIKDDNGLTIYKEKTQKSRIYPEGFDISSLPDGGYFYELENDAEIKTIPFNVNSNQVVFKYENETIINKPDVFLNKKFIYVNKLALNEEPLEVRIYYMGNNRGTLVYSETIIDTKTIKKAYEIMKHDNGTYIVVLNSDNRTYYKYFPQ